MKQQQRQYAGYDQGANFIPGLRRGAEQAEGHEEEKAENGNAADEPLFLGQHGENEIGEARGQKTEVSLGPPPKPLAKQPSRADGDLRLDRLVAETLRVAGRVEHRFDAVPLVVLEHKPGERGGDGGREDEHHQVFPADPCDRGKRRVDRHESDGGPQVPLQLDQSRRH